MRSLNLKINRELHKYFSKGEREEKRIKGEGKEGGRKQGGNEEMENARRNRKRC